MSPVGSVVERLRPLGVVFHAQEAITAGVSWRDLYRARDQGVILELSRGLYQLREADGLDQLDFVVVCARAPEAMICLVSALAYWDLTDENPNQVDLAVPEGKHRPRIDHPPTRVHVFQAATFDLGRADVKIGHTARFAITDRERSVVDAFRLRHRYGEDLAVGGLRRYLRQPRSQPARVIELASALRVRTPLMGALQLLQE
ncbi:MAG: type IV toxin-antitoxin system AbiEi family antitoxin domain-containing protein [Actinomycetota bacterium]|nr:type IV toxin-antitoxin system AbiEi family antitoxin domain-containing protein [Actinomycetota bacterium]